MEEAHSQQIGLLTKEWAEDNNYAHSYLKTTTSTNDELKKKRPPEINKKYLLITDNQTSGRGRGTNTWTSPPAGHGLLSTWSFWTDTCPQPISSPLFGWAVYKALMDVFDLNLSLKAPNDIYLDDKKVGGLLVESFNQGGKYLLLVGLGLNITAHPEGLETSSSLFENLDTEFQVNRWFDFLSHLTVSMDQAKNAGLENQLSEYFCEEILKALKRFPGNKITEVLPDGSLVLDSGATKLWSDL